MKKLFIALFAVAAATACSNDEFVSVDREAIDFGTPFIDKSTRAAVDPSYGGGVNEFTQFQVWGTANGVAIFAGENVNGTVGTNVVEGKETHVWTCTKKNYWVKGVNYDFAAVANGTVTALANGLPKTIEYTANGTSDLIYAENKGITGQAAGSNVPVAFTFSHLLAKVKFTATTNTDVEGYSYEISNITIENAYDSGVYTVSDKTWDSLAKTNGQSFDSITLNKTTKTAECAQEKLLIPIAAADKVTVSCTITLKYGEDTIWSDSPTVTVNTGLTAAHAYNFTIACNVGEEITFSVVDDPSWTNGGNVTVQ